MRVRRTLAAAIAGGLIAGATIGAVEASAVWLQGHAAGEAPALPWAILVYGLVGAAGGVGVGSLAALVGGDGFALALASVGASLAFVVARFRIIRDVFAEQVPRGMLPVVAQLAGLVVAVAVAVALWRWLRGAQERGIAATRPLAVGAGLLVGAAIAAGVGRLVAGGPPSAPVASDTVPEAHGPNVVLIAVDTLRADHLSCYGYADNRTPAIDALAADGVRFVNAFSEASWTRPSMATILSGLYPSSHGAIHKADRLPDRVDTLAERMARAGYYTAGFVDNVNIAPTFNFQQGFTEYHYLAPDLFFYASEPAAQLTLYGGLRLVHERFLARSVDVHSYYQPAEVVTDTVTRWLDGAPSRRKPFFLFVHFMDAHDPYFPHPFDGEGFARVANPNPRPEQAERLRHLYDGEISYLDEHLGRLMDELKRRGVYEQTLIILTADHGEEFHEHGGWWHGTTLYDEQMHVPLIVKGPAGGARGRVATELATSLDVTPTILAAAGVGAPKDLPGHALPWDGAGVPGRDRVMAEEDFEGNVLQAVRTLSWKLITANPGNPRGLAPEELYDVAHDAPEQHNVAGTETAQRETMRATLGQAVLEAREHAGATETGTVDAAARERLQALGYVN
jgi:arylsulfatase A-like enzyme